MINLPDAGGKQGVTGGEILLCGDAFGFYTLSESAGRAYNWVSGSRRNR